MSEQLALPWLEPARPRIDNLFYAIFVERKTAAQVVQFAQCQRDEHGLKDPALERDRLHISLHHIGQYAGLRRDIVDDAKKAGGLVTAASFEVAFNRMLSFKRKAGKRPLVLCGDDGGLVALRAFQHNLWMEVAKVGLVRKAKQSFTPHVTLLYDRRGVDERPVEAIRWTVREFALVHSLVGEHQHIQLARWSLHG